MKMAEDLKGFQGAVEKVCQIFRVEKLFPEQMNALKALISREGVFFKIANGVRKVVGVSDGSLSPRQTFEVESRTYSQSNNYCYFTTRKPNGRPDPSCSKSG